MAKSPPQFTKIVANNKHVALNWVNRRKTASEANEQTTHQLECQEKPRPDFDKALQAFVPFFLKIIGAPSSWADNTRVTGISINKEEDGRRGLVITASRKCPNGAAPIAINSPHLREAIDDKETGTQFFLEGMADAIDAMCEEASAYLGGDRSQGELFGDDDKDQKKRNGKGGEPESVGDIMKKQRGPALV